MIRINPSKILICTVGGSPQPIIQAVNQTRPDYVVFVCSEGPSSSEIMIIGKGRVIAQPGETKPSQCNIPTQLGLHEENFATLLVPPDDLDTIVSRLNERFRLLKAEHPDAVIYADYTGGTKTMTGGLILAALDNEAQIQLVKGRRTNLNKVTDGTQWGMPATVENIRFERLLKNHLHSWSQFGYGQSAAGLKIITVPPNEVAQQKFSLAKTLSEAFDAWDRFDHHNARHLLGTCDDVMGKASGNYFPILREMCDESRQTSTTAQHLCLILTPRPF